ncbi:MAG: hypothetical protein ACYDAR_18940 [Thermomicrobiales bacterium]
MQIMPSERVIPAPLTCSGCRHWAPIAAQTPANSETSGRCGRFAETRPGAARPRCNICWEPADTRPGEDRVLADS